MIPDYCKDCEVFIDRVRIAEALNELYGTDGYWDYQTCYRACQKKFDAKNEYDRVKARIYARRKRYNQAVI